MHRRPSSRTTRSVNDVVAATSRTAAAVASRSAPASSHLDRLAVSRQSRSVERQSGLVQRERSAVAFGGRQPVDLSHTARSPPALAPHQRKPPVRRQVCRHRCARRRVLEDGRGARTCQSRLQDPLTTAAGSCRRHPPGSAGLERSVGHQGLGAAVPAAAGFRACRAVPASELVGTAAVGTGPETVGAVDAASAVGVFDVSRPQRGRPGRSGCWQEQAPRGNHLAITIPAGKRRLRQAGPLDGRNPLSETRARSTHHEPSRPAQSRGRRAGKNASDRGRDYMRGRKHAIHHPTRHRGLGDHSRRRVRPGRARALFT